MKLDEAKKILKQNGYVLFENELNSFDELAAALPQETVKVKFGLRVFKEDGYQVAFISRAYPEKPYTFGIDFSRRSKQNTWRQLYTQKDSIEEVVAFIDSLCKDDTVLDMCKYHKFGSEWMV